MLEKYLALAIKDHKILPHTLLIGGSRESSANVAATLAGYLRKTLLTRSSDQIKRLCDMTACLIELDGCILFLSDLDKLNPNVEETLSLSMREHYVPITIDEWGVIRDKEIHLTPFTVIASTSAENSVIQSLNDQFSIRLHLVQ